MLRVVLAAAVAVAAGAAAAEPGDPNPPRLNGGDPAAAVAWGAAHLIQDDWLQIGSTTNQLWFVSSLPNPTADYPIVRDWVRSEVWDSSGPSRSLVALVEVDCARERARNVEYYFYQYNNMRGTFSIRDEAPDKWEPFGTGTIRQSYARVICRSAR